MGYTNFKLGAELCKELRNGYDIVRISKWAYREYMDHLRELNSDQRGVLEELFMMSDDPQFEFTETQLSFIAKTLIYSENNPIKELYNMKSEDVVKFHDNKEVKFTKKQIGKLLVNELCKEYNIKRIANWAQDLYYKIQDKGSSELVAILERLLLIDAGEEFIYTEQELWTFAKLLIDEENDPIEKLHQMKQNGQQGF